MHKESVVILRTVHGDRFDGLLPVAEDWHAKVCLLEVRVAVQLLRSDIFYIIIYALLL